MDYFKRLQKVGVGGWYCTCCGIQSNSNKKQRLNKQRIRRYARRKDKQIIRYGEI